MIELKNTTVRYGDTVAIDDVNLRIDDGDRVAVCGPNGSGKSTLLRAILSDAVAQNQHPPLAVFLPQETPAEMEMTLTAHDYVMLGRTTNLSAWKRPSAQDEASVAKAISAVGLSGCEKKRLNKLSGGMRKRLSIALALASDAPVLLLDEATAHLDQESRSLLFDTLSKSNRTVVMSIHEFPLPENFFTRIIYMENGKMKVRAIVSLGTNIEPREEHMKKAKALLAEMPETTIESESSIIETDPVDVPHDFAGMKFLNQIIVLRTSLDVHEFSKRMHAIEDCLGRVRTVRNGPRTIDVDLIDFDGLVSDDPELTLPHPRAAERTFVTSPLCELGITVNLTKGRLISSQQQLVAD